MLKIISSLLDAYPEDTYGLDIMRSTKVKSGTLYPILDRLLENDYVKAAWEDGETAVADGRPRRRYYKLTNAGASWARDALAEHGIGALRWT